MKFTKLTFLLMAALAAVSSVQAQEAVAETADETVEGSAATAEEEIVDLDDKKAEPSTPVQSGPFVDIFGPTLLSLEMVDEKSAKLQPHYTNDALRGKNVVGLYFSADW